MNLRHDLPASIAVFLVALPLCLGIALASGVPLGAGIIAGVVGGIVVGALSGSHLSVSGPAAGLVAIVIDQVTTLGSFPAFLVAVVFAGVLQIMLGLIKAGVIAYYFPSSVIRGLLAAIGVILILKQIPHAFGDDADVEGDFSFQQGDGENTFSELLRMFDQIEPAAIGICLAGLVILRFWQKNQKLAKSPVPGALVVVALGLAINELLIKFAPGLALGSGHRVRLAMSAKARQAMQTEAAHEAEVIASEAGGSAGVAFEAAGGAGVVDPTPGVFDSVTDLFIFPDFSVLGDPAVYLAGLTIAIVASLETLLNLEAVDRLDPQQRVSPPNRELVAQGCGNIVSGLVGGLPVTSVIVRSSANVYAGAQTKASAILHAVWLFAAVAFLPDLLQRIPLAALAAILLMTGYKLANPTIFRQMYRRGWDQFLPFIVTVVAIVYSDLLIGICIGLFVGIWFVLRSMESSPLLGEQTNPVRGNQSRLKLGQHVSFINRSRLQSRLDAYPPGSEVIIDASASQYVDPDVVEMIKDFENHSAPRRDIKLSLIGFGDKQDIEDRGEYVDTLTREAQTAVTPGEVIAMLKAGNERYRSGQMLDRDYGHQRSRTKASQHPVAALLSCIDSRVPAELVFDTGLGDIFSTRVAGNVVSDDVLGSLEFAGAVAGVKLIVVLGHTNCGAVGAACNGVRLGHISGLIEKIEPIVAAVRQSDGDFDPKNYGCVDRVAAANVQSVTAEVVDRSEILAGLVAEGKLAVVGGVYDLDTGEVRWL